MGYFDCTCDHYSWYERDCRCCNAVLVAYAAPSQADLLDLLRRLVEHWKDEHTSLADVTEDTWASEGERLGLRSRELKAEARKLLRGEK